MIIYSMTATFGKLEHQTLTLEPGLNVISAPNEWGKSTWCAFLCAMFYGIETRVHSKKSGLADKTHYAPWSGSPMAGSIDLCHRGRDITIQRSSNGRIPFGTFRAFETHTGLPIPELTGENCGQVLLGVEKEVFLRSALIRLTDLPVTQNEALRRRLNALVTTGDETGAAEALESRLTKLKNTIRYGSRSGLLPQAQAQLAEIRAKLEELEHYRQQLDRLEQQGAALEQQQAALLTHREALICRKAREAREKLLQAHREAAALEAQAAQLQAQCQGLPSREALLCTRDRVLALLQQLQTAPNAPEPPKSPFPEEDPDRLDRRIRLDTAAWEECNRILSQKQRPLWPWCLPLAVGAVAGGFWHWALALGLGLGAVGLLIAHWILRKNRTENLLHHRLALQRLAQWYGSDHPALWKARAEDYRRDLAAYEEQLARFRQEDQRMTGLRREVSGLTGGQAPEAFLAETHRRLSLREELDRVLRQQQLLRSFLEAHPLPDLPQPPQEPDLLTHSEEETNRLLAQSGADLDRIRREAAFCRGRMESLGDGMALTQQLRQLQERIGRLTGTLEAIDLALSTLHDATETLQRRFAPRLTRRAGALFSRLTEGRYDRMTLDRDLTLLCAARQEEILRSLLWRSDGTADQLYLALRLALWEELTPEAPLILDDALVRFDDRRLKQAMALLRELGKDKQILLFTCQSREKSILQQP